MNKKEVIKERYAVIEGNPSREERMKALFERKTIKITDYQTMYHRLDKYDRLTFSYTGHPDSFNPYINGYDYSRVLDDYNKAANKKRKVEILKEVETGGLK